jgi:hypothetical protein
MFQISRPNTVVHPRTMMIHSTDTTIANSTMMRMWWFEGLTLTAHGQLEIGLVSLGGRGDGGRWYGAGVC